MRPTWVEVDLAAIRHNAATLVAAAAPARVCAVVKAFGYGHGPVRAAEAALRGGAGCLAVALVEEGADLRRQLTEPVLLLSEPPLAELADAVALDLTPTLYTHEAVEAAAKAVAASDRTEPLPVHVKVDTGMHRVGAGAADAAAVALAVGERPELRLEALWTHFAVADEPDNPFTTEQLSRFRAVVDQLAAQGVRPPVLHACNSAGLLSTPDARFDLIRCGIALYGLAPSPELEGVVDLRPAMSLKAKVSFVKDVDAGEGISYGLRHRFERRSVVATVPIGYHDGVPRNLGLLGGEVLIGGRRRRIVGTVTMDQLMVDCGDDRSVAPGDEVVLIGTQGGEHVGAWEWARRLDTIAYEVVCGIGMRVPRRYV